MARALFNNVLIAESDDTVVVEGNHYFPRSSIVEEYFSPTDHQTVCGWKGTASYLSVSAGDRTAENAAWYYPDPMAGAEQVTDRVAFYGAKVTVEA